MQYRQHLCIFCLICCQLSAQENLPPQRAVLPSLDESLRTTLFEIETSAVIPFSSGWPGLLVPMKCTTNGDLFLRVASTTGDMALIEIRKKDLSTVVFGPERLTSLRSPNMGWFFADDSSLYVLVNSVENPRPQEFKARDPKGITHTIQGETGERLQHFAEFDHTGSLKRLVKLDLPFQAIRLGVFPSGELLIVGTDDSNGSYVGIASSDGTLRKSIALKDDPLDDSKDLKQRSDKGFGGGSSSGNRQWALLSTELVPFQNKILLMRRRQKPTVFEIDAGGGVRKTDLQVPAGFNVFSLITSNRRWIGQLLAAQGASSEAKQSSSQKQATYAFDPDSGRAIEHLVFSAPTGLGLACADDQRLYGLKRDPKEGGFVLMTIRPRS